MADSAITLPIGDVWAVNKRGPSTESWGTHELHANCVDDVCSHLMN